MKKIIINILLFFISIFLLSTIGTLGLIYTLIYSVLNFKILNIINYWGDILYSINVGIDQIGNVLLGTFLNEFALIDKGYDFGKVDQTISHVIAINYFNNNLTKFGLFIAYVLEKIDKGHLEDSL